MFAFFSVWILEWLFISQAINFHWFFDWFPLILVKTAESFFIVIPYPLAFKNLGGKKVLSKTYNSLCTWLVTPLYRGVLPIEPLFIIALQKSQTLAFLQPMQYFCSSRSQTSPEFSKKSFSMSMCVELTLRYSLHEKIMMREVLVPQFSQFLHGKARKYFSHTVGFFLIVRICAELGPQSLEDISTCFSLPSLSRTDPGCKNKFVGFCLFSVKEICSVEDYQYYHMWKLVLI